MKKLVEGVHKFRTETFKRQQELYESLSQGQNPDTLFITCSDSRIDPNLITHTDPGDLFVIRNAGNIVPPYGTTASGEIATIEYAVAALKVKNIIVCGHTLCGAMTGLMSDEPLDSLPEVCKWLEFAATTKRVVKDVYEKNGNDPDAIVNIAIQENVLVQLEHLKTHPAVASALTRGEVSLHGWVYKIQTGEVFAFDSALGQFSRLSEVSVPEGTKERFKLSQVASL